MDDFVRFFDSLLGPGSWKLLMWFAAVVLGLAALWVIGVLVGVNPLDLVVEATPKS